MRFHELKEAYFNKNAGKSNSKRDPDSKEHIGENVSVSIKRGNQ
jgi:hypothetical protein